MPHAKTCIAKDGAMIWAAQLSSRAEVLTKWGEWHLGEAGDWLASQASDRQDIYNKSEHYGDADALVQRELTSFS